MSLACHSCGAREHISQHLVSIWSRKKGPWLESCCLAIRSCKECWKRIMNISDLYSWEQQERRDLRDTLGAVHRSLCHILRFRAVYWLFLGFRFHACTTGELSVMCGSHTSSNGITWKLESHPGPTESETLRAETNYPCFNRPSRHFWCTLKSEYHCLKDFWEH